MLSPLASSDDASIQKQVTELRSMLIDNQLLAEKHLENLYDCADRIDVNSIQNTHTDIFNDMNNQLNELLYVFRNKLNQKEAQSPINKLNQLKSTTTDPTLQHLLDSGGNLLNCIQEEGHIQGGILSLELAADLENCTHAFQSKI